MISRLTRSTLFPYTTLFRSWLTKPGSWLGERYRHGRSQCSSAISMAQRAMSAQGVPGHSPLRHRSEEHTSELQSHSDLVCRLLLEKKKNREKNDHSSNQRQR